jgi:hypothetical protein
MQTHIGREQTLNWSILYIIYNIYVMYNIYYIFIYVCVLDLHIFGLHSNWKLLKSSTPCLVKMHLLCSYSFLNITNLNCHYWTTFHRTYRLWLWQISERQLHVHCLLGCTFMQSGRLVITFWRNVLPPNWKCNSTFFFPGDRGITFTPSRL